MSLELVAKPQGRLANHDLEPGTDPRINQKLLKDGLSRLGLQHKVPTSALGKDDASFEDMTKVVEAGHEAFTAAFGDFPNDLPEDANEPKVERTVETIKGVDGNDIKLYIWHKAGTSGTTLPAVIYLHGGGMVVLDTDNRCHNQWCVSLAQAGCVAISVDFRNAWTKEAYNPFPAGLNDCAAGVRWIAASKSKLGVDKIVVQGESGGGNLALATALKAKQEGWLGEIDGVYACCPYISNLWGESNEYKANNLPSIVENDGYLLESKGMGVLGYYYGMKDTENPLAWPYHATVYDVEGLPPHFLSMDECDMLRDEGVAYYRKLTAAGVNVVGQINLGLTHAASLIFRKPVPEANKAMIHSIITFAEGLPSVADSVASLKL